MGAGLLDSLQTGFRRFNSTQTAFLKLTDDIRVRINDKMVTFILLFDFSKAFDTISPSRLIRKLRDMGFSRTLLMWVKTYMVGRSRRVVSSSGESDYLETNLGVPKGSVLGPLLFSIYINNLQSHLNLEGVGYILYANDLLVYLTVHPGSSILSHRIVSMYR